MTVLESDWSAAVAALGGARQVALACHVAPDGDALGSTLAFALALRRAGTPCVASFGDKPFAVPRLLRFLPGQQMLVPPDAFPAEPQVMVAFDTGNVERLGLLAPNAARAETLIVIDHHLSGTGFGDVRLVDTSAAATAVLVTELLDRMGEEITRDIAACLYTGLVTDTGSFRYSATTPAVHALAGRLLETGISTDEIARELWDRARFGYLHALGETLRRAVLEPGIVWTYVTRADRAAYGLAYDEIEGIIDVVRRIDEADVAVVLKEDDEGAWQVSTRSKGESDVGRVCAALGGGGHAFAAGFTSHLAVEETMAAFRALLAELGGRP
ncbi:DHH family phosphoesterase [Rhizohabitans arisaemae]|uniref:DHH family phosphoesterase n=1 Tax=Rhizohabitans arisaemae TaxID=2720610 RepID=UPI0024B0FFD5|nr:bifunctional oligoribonuclease/PAP phosphatase NrnA [Rhizohabitans arisaemae]